MNPFRRTSIHLAMPPTALIIALGIHQFFIGPVSIQQSKFAMSTCFISLGLSYLIEYLFNINKENQLAKIFSFIFIVMFFFSGIFLSIK